MGIASALWGQFIILAILNDSQVSSSSENPGFGVDFPGELGGPQGYTARALDQVEQGKNEGRKEERPKAKKKERSERRSDPRAT